MPRCLDPLTLASLGYTPAKELAYVGRLGTMSAHGCCKSRPWRRENAYYDANSRLKDWQTGTTYNATLSGNATEAYNLDPAGNWNSLSLNGGTPITRTHTNAKNQITAIGGNAVIHDARGNMEQNNSGDTFTYDILNQLVASNVVVGSNNPVSTYTYDALGRRVRQTVVDGSSTVLDKIYFYGPDFKLLESADITTATSSSFVISTSSFKSVVWGRSFNEIVFTTTDNYLHGDQINSVIGNSDASGTVTKVLTYTPYGQRSEWTYSSGSITAATFALGTMDFGYSGELRDPSGLIYYGYRYYNPELGRWINRDPIGETGGVNLYEMLKSSIFVNIDYNGLFKITNKDGGFSKNEIKLLEESQKRLSDKISNVLIPEIDYQLSIIKQMKGCCWNNLAKELEFLKKLLTKMKKDLDDPSKVLDVKIGVSTGSTGGEIHFNRVTDIWETPTIHFNTDKTGSKIAFENNTELDAFLANEISNYKGATDGIEYTDRGISKNSWANSSEQIEKLVRNSIADNKIYQNMFNDCNYDPWNPDRPADGLLRSKKSPKHEEPDNSDRYPGGP